MQGRRPERIAEQIREEVTMIIDGDLEDPRIGSVTVTEVKVTPDLRHAKIYVSVMGTKQESEESLEALRHASGFIRRQLGSVMRIKFTPELQFVFDDTDERAARIEELLQEEVLKAREREQDQEMEEGSLLSDAGPGAADEHI